MKKSLVCILILVGLDQVIKLLVAHYCINANIILIPGALFLRPVQNTNLNWIASIMEYKTHVLLMIAVQIFALAIIILCYHYLSYLWTQGRKLLNGMAMFYTAGITCSFVDVVLWGGSLDFLRLFDWFTFDAKDMYLNIGLFIMLVFSVNYYMKKYRKMSKTERKQTSILFWLRQNILSSPRE